MLYLEVVVSSPHFFCSSQLDDCHPVPASAIAFVASEKFNWLYQTASNANFIACCGCLSGREHVGMNENQIFRETKDGKLLDSAAEVNIKEIGSSK